MKGILSVLGLPGGNDRTSIWLAVCMIMATVTIIAALVTRWYVPVLIGIGAAFIVAALILLGVASCTQSQKPT